MKSQLLVDAARWKWLTTVYPKTYYTTARDLVAASLNWPHEIPPPPPPIRKVHLALVAM